MNSCLVTKTLLYNAARIIDDADSFTLDRFFDLSALIEAVILFDELTAIESSNVLPAFELTTQLCDRGVLKEHPPYFPEFGEWINQLPDFVKAESIETFWEKGKQPSLQPRLQHRGHYRKNDFRPGEGRDYDKDGHILPNSLVMVGAKDSKINPIEGLTEWINDLAFYPSATDDVRASAFYIRRTIGYLLVAMGNRVDYFPDSLRIPYVASYMERIYRSLSREVYAKVADVLETDLKTIDAQTKSRTFPIPPFTALVLSEASSREAIPWAILELRDKLAPFRDNLSEIDHRLKNGRSLDEKLKSYMRREELFKELVRNEKQNEFISFKEGIEFVGQLAKPIADIANPTSYSSALIAQPVEWLQRWWLRRPIQPLFRLDRKVRQLAGYDTLIRKHWGYQITEDMVKRFEDHASAVEEIFTMS